MSEPRLTVDTITSDQLDALYERVAKAEQDADDSVAAAARLTTLVGKRAEKAEAVIKRVRALCADPNHSNMLLTRNLLAALDEPKEQYRFATTWSEYHAGRRALDEPGPAATDADVQRVIDLYERWVKAGPPPLGTSMSRWWDVRLAELHAAINPPKEPTT
ncbi:hypothetical protein [Streptomyces sp.]|uniref:hypothetical protein n=1 Tax=Streptomyces sp. TaxID=1931 RepID=UPI002D793D44|nr:hypothetical protein [Streptomyces sp.]HET6355997.1 hypothetical protein [Streptomyces sp.]